MQKTAWILAPLGALVILIASPALGQRQAPLSSPTAASTRQAPAPRLGAPAAEPAAGPAIPNARKKGQTGWIQPVPGKITNAFGNSYQYFQIYRGGHTGVDIAAPKGTPVKAVAAGKVVRVWTVPNQRYGNYVVVQHSPQLYSLYGHLQQIRVRTGQSLSQGQILAGVGVTGAAGYPHLHLEALDRLPRHDGAWGYLYICRGEREQVSFVNQPAYVISAIQRQAGAACQPKALAETLTYFNPEVLWNPSQPALREVSQPENEETRWRRATRPAGPPPLPTAVARPAQQIKPLLQPIKASVGQLATPDKAAAPGEPASP